MHIILGEKNLSVSDIVAIAHSRVKVEISQDDDFRSRMNASRSVLNLKLQQKETIYGVTTGYGDSCGTRVNRDESQALGKNLIRYHGCGVGDPFEPSVVRSAMVCRMACLSRAESGVSSDLLEALANMLNHGIVPVVPKIGSVGASGDLTPMSYIAAALQGDREVFLDGERMSAVNALASRGLSPYEFREKEPLAIMNGTSVMTGLACLEIDRIERILDAVLTSSSLVTHALGGHAHHYSEELLASKPHPGQIATGRKLRHLLSAHTPPPESDVAKDFQDPYSVRCVPQILGVLFDTLSWAKEWIEREVNSTNDNPLVLAGVDEIVHGCNFYGGHVAFAMDSLKSALASTAGMLDRQIALLVDARYNRGLPSNLVKTDADVGATHHGFKGLQITASALTAQIQRNAMPSGPFSRSTESHNQDIVPMGMLAAHGLTEQRQSFALLTAIHLIVSAQASSLRGDLQSRPLLLEKVMTIREHIEGLDIDRPLDQDIQQLLTLIEGDGL